MRKAKVGDKVKVKPGVLTLFPDDTEYTVKRVAFTYVYIRPKRGREDIELFEDDIIFLEPEQLTGDEKKGIVRRLVERNTVCGIKDMSREIRHLNVAIVDFPDLNFWRQFHPGFQVKSIIWWINNGRTDLEKFYKQFTLDFQVKTPIIEENKIGADGEVNTAPKTLREWLK